MKTLLLKEARMLLPVWVAALLLAVVPVWLTGLRADLVGTALLWFGGGVVLLSVAPFGLEFSNGTFQLLLVQPVTRWRIWLVKVFVLTVALCIVLGFFWLSLRCRLLGTHYEPHLAEVFDLSGMLVLLGLAGGLWTTLLLRQIAAAIWFTPLVPAVLALLVLDLPMESSTEKGVVPTVVVLIVYAVLGILWAAWLFARAQDAQWTGGTVSLSLHRFWPARAQARPQTKPRLRWLALFIKEIHLHQPSLLLVGVAVVFHVTVILVRALARHPASPQTYETLKYLDLSVWFLWFVVPVMLGAMAVAEERKLGTLEGQLCLPIRRPAQFGLKLLVILVLSMVFAGLLPWVLDQFRIWSGVHDEVGLSKRTWEALVALLAIASVTGAVSFYASSMARNTFQALGLAVVLGVVGALVADMVSSPQFHLGNLRIGLWDGPLISYIGWPVMGATAFCLAYANFKRLHEGDRLLVRNLLALLGALVVVTTVTAFTYLRAWEFVLPLEPSHGPARISQSGRTKICDFLGNDKWLVLLPDGRLWASRDYLRGEMTGFKQWKRKPPPSNAGFLPGSNWIDVAGTLQEAVALKVDGSLWTLFRYRRGQPAELVLSRLGIDTNWVQLAGGSHHFLAVKQDGTLWGWGDNSGAQLAIDLPKTNQALVRIGTDSDWTACMTYWGTSIGVKRNGTVWRWGGWEVDQNHVWTLVLPTRLRLNGVGLKAISRGPDGGWIGLYTDGTLWYASPEQTGRNSTARPPSEPYRVGSAADWLDMYANGPRFVGVKRDGSLWILRLDRVASKGWQVDLASDNAASKYTDWIATSTEYGNLMTLAADGTLCAWPLGYQESTDLLCPTRFCPGSVNIFETPTMLTKAAP